MTDTRTRDIDYEYAIAAIDAFLDEVTRPCGERKFTIPDTVRVHDAIRAMADAVGRDV